MKNKKRNAIRVPSTIRPHERQSVISDVLWLLCWAHQSYSWMTLRTTAIRLIRETFSIMVRRTKRAPPKATIVKLDVLQQKKDWVALPVLLPVLTVVTIATLLVGWQAPPSRHRVSRMASTKTQSAPRNNHCWIVESMMRAPRVPQLLQMHHPHLYFTFPPSRRKRLRFSLPHHCHSTNQQPRPARATGALMGMVPTTTTLPLSTPYQKRQLQQCLRMPSLFTNPSATRRVTIP